MQANKRVAKKANVVLTQSVDKLGNAGDLVEVSLGFFRNHLEPMGKAKKATAEILAEVEASAAAEVAAKNAESAGAKAIATALKTIGKFVVKKTVGEDGKIFGSVTAAEVADAVEQQTGKALDKKSINVPGYQRGWHVRHHRQASPGGDWRVPARSAEGVKGQEPRAAGAPALDAHRDHTDSS